MPTSPSNVEDRRKEQVLMELSLSIWQCGTEVGRSHPAICTSLRSRRPGFQGTIRLEKQKETFENSVAEYKRVWWLKITPAVVGWTGHLGNYQVIVVPFFTAGLFSPSEFILLSQAQWRRKWHQYKIKFWEGKCYKTMRKINLVLVDSGCNNNL